MEGFLSEQPLDEGDWSTDFRDVGTQSVVSVSGRVSAGWSVDSSLLGIEQKKQEASVVTPDVEVDDDDDDSLLDILRNPPPKTHSHNNENGSEVSSLSSLYTTPSKHRRGRGGSRGTDTDGELGGNTSRGSQEALNEMRRKVQRQTHQNRILLCASVAVAMLAVGAGAGVAIVLFRGQNTTSDTPESNPRSTLPPAGAPVAVTPSPTKASPSSSPSDDAGMLTREDMESAVHAKSPTAAFDIFTSASRQAMDWLVGGESNDFNQDLLKEGDTDKLLQRYALAALYFSIAASKGQALAEGRLTIDETWLRATDECGQWTGITCDSEGLVTAVELAATLQFDDASTAPGSRKQFSTDFFLLLADTLQILDLSQNRISQATIPTELGVLSQLTALSFSENEFISSVPTQISNMTKLGHLALGSNQLDGSVPSLTDLSQLSYLDLRANALLGGDLSLEGLDSLETLLMDSTNITSNVPDELCGTLVQATIECSNVVCSCCTSIDGGDCETSPSTSPSLSPSPIGPSMTPSALDSSSEVPSKIPSSSMSPTTAPSMPTTAPTTTAPTTIALTRVDIARAILLQSPSSDLVQTDSAARRALDWLVEQDSYSGELMVGGGANLSKLLQRFALATLFESTDGENWTESENWLTASDECSGWYGIGCQEDEVTEISLDGINLIGRLPPEIFIILKGSLQHVGLDANEVTGSIPTEVGLANRVRVFAMMDNELIGTIPTQIGDMPSLLFLDLARNKLGGSIPRTIGLLSKLTHFSVFANQLEGKIPTEVGKIVTLRHFTASSNQLTGPIPPIPDLISLSALDLSGNLEMSGQLPLDFGTLDSLKALDLFDTNLSGIVPSTLCDTLERAWIECQRIRCMCCTAPNNIVCPPLPTLFPAPTFAPVTPRPTLAPTASPTLAPTQNPTPPPTQFPTPPPTQFPTLAPTFSPTPRPTELDVRGTILRVSPASTVDDSDTAAGKALEWMLLDPYTKFIVEPSSPRVAVLMGAAGVIQRFVIATLYFALDGEGWTGGQNEGWLTPESEGELGSVLEGSECQWNRDHLGCNSEGEIISIQLKNINGLSGQLPMELGLLSSSLRILDIEQNRNGIGGPIPSEIGELTSLTELSLAKNNLSGGLPTSLNQLVNLRKFQVDENDMIGPLLRNFGEWDELLRLALNSNGFTGTVPPGINELSKLTYLNLELNELEGPIPDDLEGLESIQYLYLFGNELTGTIATTLCNSLQEAEAECFVNCTCCDVFCKLNL